MLQLNLLEVTKNLEKLGGDELIKENKKLNQLVEKFEEQAFEDRSKFDSQKA